MDDAAALAACWYGFLAAGAVYLAIVAPESFRFRGDTLGLDFSLAWIAPLLLGAVVAMAIAQPHGPTDQVGVVLTIVQWLLVGRALRPA